MNDNSGLSFQELEMEGNTVLKYLSNNKDSIIIPDGVEVIGENAFSYHKEIKSISFPASLRRISKSAFQGCSKLMEITIAGEDIYIEQNAFTNCGLKTVDLSKVACAETSAFSFCPLERVFLGRTAMPSNLHRFQDGAFKCIESEHKHPIVYCDTELGIDEIVRLLKPDNITRCIFVANTISYRILGKSLKYDLSDACREFVYAPNLLEEGIEKLDLTLEDLFTLLDSFISDYCGKSHRIHYGGNEFVSWIISRGVDFDYDKRELGVSDIYDCSYWNMSIRKYVFEKYYYHPLRAVLKRIADLWQQIGTETISLVLSAETRKDYFDSLYVGAMLLKSISRKNVLLVDSIFSSLMCLNSDYTIIEANGLKLVCDDKKIVKAIGECDYFVIDNRFSEIKKYAFGPACCIKAILIKGDDVSIEEYAFSGSSIETLTIEGVREVKQKQFAEMHDLKDVYIKDGCISFNRFAFLRSAYERYRSCYIAHTFIESRYMYHNPEITFHILTPEFDKSTLDMAVATFYPATAGEKLSLPDAYPAPYVLSEADELSEELHDVKE